LIPPFDERGNLPPGVHSATLDEVIHRFGRGSDQREAQAQSLQWLVPLCRRAGVTRLLINGSFVTAKEEPNDLDCVALQGPSYSALSPEAEELHQGLPFVELKVVNQADYARFRDVLFASDRDMIPKGVVELLP
jgi:hypothetical protein